MKSFKQQIIDREDKAVENWTMVSTYNTFIKSGPAKESLNLLLGSEFKEVYLSEAATSKRDDIEFSSGFVNIGHNEIYVLTKQEKVIRISSSVYCDVEFKEI